jgi:hypothetical protein
MVFECATAWYEYGNALLIKEEDAPSDHLLANAEKPAEPADGDEDGEVFPLPTSLLPFSHALTVSTGTAG